MEFRVIGKETAGLNNILICSRWQHMHGIDIGFGKDRGRSGNDWNEDLMSLMQLADINITDHTGPPKALTDRGFGSIEGFVTK
jgi:hypothetical protein